MTNQQESYEKMSVASVTFLTANATITAAMPGFAGYFTTIQVTNGQILTTKVLQQGDKGEGDTDAKNLLKVALIAQAMDVCRKLVAYATNVNNSSLLGLVNYKEATLKKSSDSKLVSISQVVRDNANSNAAALVAYGVTAAMITALQTSINSFNAAIPKVRVDTTDIGLTTTQLAVLFKTLVTNWEKIDTLVEIVRSSQSGFYSEYQKVRKVIKTGGGSLALKVKVKNGITGEPEANVTLTFTPVDAQLRTAASANSKGNLVKKTAKGGGVNVKSMPDGNYTVVGKKPGFKDVAETVSVVGGELTALEVVMEKM